MEETVAPGLLSCPLMGVTKIPVKENLCTTVPCQLAFPKETLGSSMITGYWINKNTSAPLATNKSNVVTDAHDNGRFHILWNLEERDCTLLIPNALKRDNATHLSPADLQEQKTALLRENITLFLSDLTQKPGLCIADIPMAGASVTLTCTIRSSCIEARARFLSWKEPSVSFSTNGSGNSSASSSVLHFTPKPKDHGTGAALQCYLNFPLSNSTAVRFSMTKPPTLFYYVCSLKKNPQCNCSFYGTPTPVVQWFMEDVPMSMKNTSGAFQVTTIMASSWANSTIEFTGEPEAVTSLRCEGKNTYGIQEATIFLVPDESSIPIFFVKGLIQGIVYGVIIPALFYFFLVLLVIRILKWWVMRQIPKEEEALILKKPELLEEPEEPETSKETEDAASSSGTGEKSLEQLAPKPSTSQAAALLQPAAGTL